ncbi:MAG TPA: class I SAM-dependent methyltransferase [Candidatus Saccharimonadales bacterium]|nr:class I SAM-dependent methyltransferase [Candidatus Saccharimonadales bacterium]
MADLPLILVDELGAQLAGVLDVEGKIPRALASLGPLDGRDVVLLDVDGPIRARQLAELGARLTLLNAPGRSGTPAPLPVTLDGGTIRVVDGQASLIGPPDEGFDAVVSCWSSFRDRSDEDLVEAERVLRPGGRLLVLHDYGRDDVSRLRGPDLPEYNAWSRPDGWFLRNGFKIRVIHCWWTFDSIQAATEFLGAAFGASGSALGQALRRPRLSYNVAIYHRTAGPISQA